MPEAETKKDCRQCVYSKDDDLNSIKCILKDEYISPLDALDCIWHELDPVIKKLLESKSIVYVR
jgi:hypothetical protein